MPNPIPAQSRAVVLDRDRRCVRCGSTGQVAWHHRRSRRVPGEHQHCAGNGVLLCSPCHAHVHANPAESSERGLIVSSFIDEPESIPLKSWRGWLMHDHDGNWEPFPARPTERNNTE